MHSQADQEAKLSIHLKMQEQTHKQILFLCNWKLDFTSLDSRFLMALGKPLEGSVRRIVASPRDAAIAMGLRWAGDGTPSVRTDELARWLGASGFQGPRRSSKPGLSVSSAAIQAMFAQ